MINTLKKLIKDRGTDINDKRVIMGQISMQGGLQIVGAISFITGEEGEPIGYCVGAVPLNPQNPRLGMKIIEQYFNPFDVTGITIQGSPELAGAYEKLWNQGNSVAPSKSALEI
ncbi:MAG: hypothetical protein Q8S00_32580 [Deltaproteobacteria bacterium]|nr:hypothetical protein [Deltaproteobacteria bacterium]